MTADTLINKTRNWDAGNLIHPTERNKGTIANLQREVIVQALPIQDAAIIGI